MSGVAPATRQIRSSGSLHTPDPSLAMAWHCNSRIESTSYEFVVVFADDDFEEEFAAAAEEEEATLR